MKFLKASVLITLLSVFAGGGDFLLCLSLHEFFRKEKPEIVEFDGPELAAAQEFERTKDPALGYVPRERLVQAFRYAQKMRHEADKWAPSFTDKTAAAISGITWTERGPNNFGGRTRAIMVDPNDATKKTVFAAGVDGGLWKTTDITVASPAWAVINDFLSNIAITTIAYNPASTTTMYFGTGEGWFNIDAVRGDGIWKSTDGGSTWAQLASTASNVNFDYVQKIVVDAAGNVYAATSSQFCNAGGVYKSTDGGTTWALVLGTQGAGCYPVSNCSAADIEIANGGTLFASLGIFYQGSVWKSATGNAGTWSQVNTGANGFPTAGFYRVELACAPSNGNTVYALTHNSATNGILNIYKTTDGGTTWAATTLPTNNGGCDGAEFTNGQAWYDLAVAVDPNNANNVLAGGLNLFKTTNGGTNWTQITQWYGGCGYQYVHSDQHCIVFEPGSSDVAYFGNDGGIWRTANGTAATPTISTRDPNYNVTQLFACALDPTGSSNYFLAGAQDNGSHKYTVAGINSTTQVTGGDGGFCHIDQNQSQYQFTAYVYNNYFRSTDGGNTWSAQISFNNNGQFINPSDYDNTANIIYAGTTAGNYFRWNDPQTGNSSSTMPVAAFGGGSVTHVAVSPNTANRVFFGINNGRVVRVDNANGAGPTGTNISTGLPSGTVSVSCVAIETGNDNHLLATYSNYGLSSVWESTNGGTSWTAVEGNLPDMPIRWAIFNPNSNTQALVATELGIWSTDLLNGGSTNWGASNTGLANVRVDMLKTRSSDKWVLAATHGRGLFSSTTFAPAPIELTSFSGKHEHHYNHLLWETATELNNKEFEIQRSDNGTGFYPIGVLKGAGNSSSNVSYEFIDDRINLPVYYYRLRQVDYDGQNKLSPVIMLASQELISASSVYPNPFTEQVNISFNASFHAPTKITITDISGKTVYRETKADFSGDKLTLNLSHLGNGIYYLSVTTAEQQFFVVKIVKTGY